MSDDLMYVVATSDNYRYLMPEFADRFNKFIGTNKCDVLCYQPPPKLPSNFNIVNMGIQPEGKVWTTPLIPYFASITKPFVLLLEDYFITELMDFKLLSKITDTQLYWDKIDLSQDRTHYPHSMVSPEVLLSSQYARYRSSLQAAVWKPAYFRNLLRPGLTAWQFETEGEKRTMHDGARIFGTIDGILKYDNAMLKGETK